MNLDALKNEDADFLIKNVNKKVKLIFHKKEYSENEKRAIYRYLFSRRPKKLPPSLKSRLIALYDPMADRAMNFPDGLRWCINVYVGCKHNCGYCYVNGYSQEAVGNAPHIKKDFERNLMKDLQALDNLGVPSVPLHMSNSTDPLERYLEPKYRHTFLVLHKIAERRSQFTSVVMLTKNPEILCDRTYLDIIASPEMRPFTVQISCSFWRDEAMSFFEPNAPSINSRLDALTFLANNGIDVDLRIDPLFPSYRVDETIRRHKPLPYYSIPEAQTQDDLANLVRFAKDNGAKKIIVNTLKVVLSNKAQQCKDWFADIYADASPDRKRTVKGAAWRLPENYKKALLDSVGEICSQQGIAFAHCKHDVLLRD